MGQFPQIHETPELFQEALLLTEARTGFSRRLVEKDYYCSLILADFKPLFTDVLVFKGGTSLSKVHGEFYRLSEDLDFAISTPINTPRSKRRKIIAPIRMHLDHVAGRLPAISVHESFRGHDDCRQYNATLRYRSSITGESEVVKIEVSVREPIIEETTSCVGRTLLLHPPLGGTESEVLSVRVMSLRETYAEKVRAALSRQPPAIRDIFDIDEAVRANRIDIYEARFLDLVKQKMNVPGNGFKGMSEVRRNSLANQLETNLKPVLRSSDYAVFNLDKAMEVVDEVVGMLLNGGIADKCIVSGCHLSSVL